MLVQQTAWLCYLHCFVKGGHTYFPNHILCSHYSDFHLIRNFTLPSTLQTVGSRSAEMCAFLCCAYGFCMVTCQHSDIQSCLQWWKRSLSKWTPKTYPACFLLPISFPNFLDFYAYKIILFAKNLFELAVVPNRFGNKGKYLALYKGTPYFAVSITR